MNIIDPNAALAHLTQGLRERAADLGDEDRFQQGVLATIAVVPQHHRRAMLGRRASLLFVAAALLALLAGSMAVGAIFQQRQVPLLGMIAVAADARAGADLQSPLDPIEVEYGPGPRDIFVIGPGLAPRLAFPAPPPGVERRCPAYSPDGRRFVHLETSDDGTARYVISWLDQSGLPASTEAVIMAPADPSAPPSCAKWSSDGQALAYEAPDKIGQMEIHVHGSGGDGVIINPTPNTTTVGGFAWSPLDHTIAYVDDGLFIVPVDGSPARLLMPSKDEETIEWITWAPDGSTLDVGVDLYDIVQEANGLSGTQTGSEIRRIRLDGTIESVLEGMVGRNWPTIWSPDGQTIAYGTDAGIVLRDRGGKTTGVLRGEADAPDDSNPQPMAWSPDGREMLAVVPADDRGGSTLALLSTDRSTVAHLTPITRAFEYVDRESVSWHPTVVASQ